MDSGKFSSTSGRGRGQRSWTPPLVAELQSLLPQYQFQELIGRGDRSAVYRAVQRSRDRNVAIKVLPADQVTGNDPEFVDRLRRDAKALSDLTHPGIGGVYEQGEVGLLFYLVLELIDGTDLARHLRVHGAFSQSESVDIAIQICDALEIVHQRGVVHRDLRPATLLRENSGRVKIVDFGLARGGIRSGGRDAGDFAAPETVAGEGDVDGRADLYSLGVILYQLLTGEVPRGPWIPPSQKSEVDPRFDAIIDRATRPNPAERYATAAEFRRDLKAIEKKPLAGFHRRRWGRILAGAAAVLALMVGATLLWRGRGASMASETRSVPELGPGAVQGVEIPNGSAAVDPDESTVEFWALPTSAGWGSLFSAGAGGGSGALGAMSAMAGMLGPNAGIPSMSGLVANAAGRLVTPRLPVNPGSWTHLAFVASRSRDVTRLYTNGALFASKPGVSRRAASTNDTQSLWIGRSPAGSMRGSVTDFRVWNRARYEEEIRADYRRELKGNEPGLVVYLPLREGHGTTATNRAAATGAKFDATLHGNPTWRTRPDPGRAHSLELAHAAGSNPVSTNARASRSGASSPGPDTNQSRSHLLSAGKGFPASSDSNGPSGGSATAPGGLMGSESNRFGRLPPAVLEKLAARNRMLGDVPGTNSAAPDRRAHGDTALGEFALQAAGTQSSSNAVTSLNVALGHAALQTNTVGTNLLAVGSNALRLSRRGTNSIAVGSDALAIAEATDGNTTVGSRALATIQRGSGTIAIGAHAGDGLRRGTNNLYVGTTSFPDDRQAGEMGAIRIGEPGGSHQALYLGGVTRSESGDAELLGIRQDGQILRIHTWDVRDHASALVVDDAGHLGRSPGSSPVVSPSEGVSFPPGSYVLLLEGFAPPAGFHRLGVVEADHLGTFTPDRRGGAALRFALFVKD